MFSNRKYVNPVHALFALVVSASLLPTAMAQFVQQGGKLVGTGRSQGGAVALSADGNTAIVTCYGSQPVGGAAIVFTRASGVWSQQGAALAGTDGVYNVFQAWSVALSADGNTAIVGQPLDNANVGGAWVYARTGGVWSQQGAKLVGHVARADYGRSVGLSADGNTAIVGSGGDDGAWVLTRKGGVWSQQGGKLVGSDSIGNSFQGSAVALSADGNTSIVVGYSDNGGVGAAWVFTRTGDVWNQQGGKLVASGRLNSQLGNSAALSADGNTAIVGTWVFTRTGSVWSQQGGALVGSGSVGNGDGYSVALSGDGGTALIGGPYDNNNVGATWVFTRTGGAWSQQGGKLAGTGSVGFSEQGGSVALSSDGKTALVGGVGDNANNSSGRDGAAWVFVNPAISTDPSISSIGVVNGASFLPGIAPGTWISIQGVSLSSVTRSWTSADFLGSSLPTQLDGVSVIVNGKPAYIYYISPTQLNVLTPADTTQGSVPVQVTTANVKSNVVNANAATLAPALFTFSQQGGRYVAAVRSDGAYIAPPDLITGLPAVPAKPGDIILLYGTGFGPTTPPSPIGQVINPAPLATPVTVSIGGIVVNPQFAGIVSPGLYQFNVVVPNLPNGDNAVSIGIGNSSSQPNVFLTVQR